MDVKLTYKDPILEHYFMTEKNVYDLLFCENKLKTICFIFF